MTTPEEHWAGLSGDKLVAELRKHTNQYARTTLDHGLLRAAEVIEELLKGKED